MYVVLVCIMSIMLLLIIIQLWIVQIQCSRGAPTAVFLVHFAFCTVDFDYMCMLCVCVHV